MHAQALALAVLMRTALDPGGSGWEAEAALGSGWDSDVVGSATAPVPAASGTTRLWVARRFALDDQDALSLELDSALRSRAERCTYERPPRLRADGDAHRLADHRVALDRRRDRRAMVSPVGAIRRLT